MQAPALAPKRRTGRGSAPLRLALLVALSCGCNLENAGDEPPPDLLYFPNALALSVQKDGSAPRYLFIANSNYDLRYKSGTVQAISLDELERAIDACATDPCTIPPAEVIEDEVFIGSYSTALEMAPDGETLFVATRTDDSLGFIQVDADANGDDVLSCGNPGRTCNSLATRGPDPVDGEPLDWPIDPVAIVAAPLSQLTGQSAPGLGVLVAHRAGAVSLFLADGTDVELTAVLSNLPNPLTEIAFDPVTRLAYATVARSGIARVGVALARDGESGTVYDAGAVDLEATSSVPSTRDLVFVPPVPMAPEPSLAAPFALIVAQNPDALLQVDMDIAIDPAARERAYGVRVKRATVVGEGASRVATGTLQDGRPIAVVACFDSREIYVIDLTTMLPRSVVPNLSGPFDIALDQDRALVYVTDFRSSVIRVLDLAPLLNSVGEAPVEVVATIGKTRVLQELR